ncbi:MAG: DegT/DnrJ/EryC1/StrS family aminotransferase [Lachnospiraceae bacterium]|nr:DegT/DnrJ/EryC1/StrS family aminotransferase [Lachnospiraceae bacterium]
MQFRDLKAQYIRLKPEIDAAIASVLDSTQFIRGEPVKRLEEKLADYVGVKHCITCANGTDALEVALKTMGIKKGDAVFVPDFTFLSTAEAVNTIGATPVFVDVYYDTCNISVESLEAAIEKTLRQGKLCPKVIIPVGLFGLPADHARLDEVAKKYKLLILEDAAQSFGGKIGKQKSGTFGEIAITSFFPAKPLGCYGDGGAIFTNNDEWADYMRSFCIHGQGKSKYENIRTGRNSRLDTIQAAILEVKLKAFIDFELEAVNKAAKWYMDNLSNRYECPVIPDGYYSSFAQYTIKIKDEEIREKIMKKLAESGIPSVIHYPIPLHRQGAYQSMMCKDEDFPVTEKLVKKVLSLPLGADMKESDILMITDIMNQI